MEIRRQTADVGGVPVRRRHFVTYVIFFVAPNDPAKLAAGKSATPEQVEQVAEVPEPRQAGLEAVRALAEAARLRAARSAGRSSTSRTSTTSSRRRRPVTASLVFGGAILWLLVSIPIGVLSALKPRSLIDRGAMVFVLIGISAHPVWIGLILVVRLRLVPRLDADLRLLRLRQPGARRGNAAARCNGPTT